MNKFLITLLFLFSAGFSFSQSPNFSEDVASIIYNNCTSCHRSGGISSLPLASYTDVANAVFPVLFDVTNGIMPPWPPDANYRHYAHERSLTSQEISTIQRWVNGGMPQGNPALAPPVPVFPNGSVLPNPDLVLTMQPYTVDSLGDLYRCFVLPSGLTQSQFITAMEVIPGDRSIVHHVLVYEDTTGICRQLDNADPGPGYTNFGGSGNNDARLIGAFVPGSLPYYFPNGMGVNLHRNADIVIQVHYPGGSFGKTDSTSVHLFLSNNSLRDVSLAPILYHYSPVLINGPLVIPVNTVKTFKERYTVPSGYNISVLGVAPHMHTVGKTFLSYAITPSGDTIRLIKIDDWDFHWQGMYYFQKVQLIPGGSTLYAEATYDNTVNNPSNPHNPPQLIQLGESTDDEMMLEYFSFLQYQPGDENIIMDSTILAGIHAVEDDLNFTVYPNPAFNSFTIKSNGNDQQILITNVLGQEIYSAAFKNEATLNVSGWTVGTYFIHLRDKKGYVRNGKVEVCNF